MDEVDRWIYLNGPEPEVLRPLLDALRGSVAMDDEDDAALERALLARIDGKAPSPSLPIAPIPPVPPASTWLPASPSEVPARFTHQREEASEPSIAPLAARSPDEAPPAPVSTARPSLASTGLVLDVERLVREGAKLPFRAPTSAPSPVTPVKGSAKTQKVPVIRGPGDTVGVDDTSISQAVAAVPFLGETIGTARVPLPRLTVAHYASLRAELFVHPEATGTTMHRYRVVSLAALRAPFAHWAERFARSPAEKAEYEAILPGFVAHVRATPR